MGLFGKFAYSAGRWTTDGPTAVPFLLLDVHDGDVVTVDYRSADASGGRFFLGTSPASTSTSADAADPVDTADEAAGFAAWAREAGGREVDPAEVEQLMASPDGTPPPAEVPVEETVERLLALAGLPAPDWPTDDDAPAG